jgi:hypothetical protein
MRQWIIISVCGNSFTLGGLWARPTPLLPPKTARSTPDLKAASELGFEDIAAVDAEVRSSTSDDLTE